MTKSTCTPKRKALARTFKKMAKHDIGGIILPNVQAQVDALKSQQTQLTQLAFPQVEVQQAQITPAVHPAVLNFGEAFKQARASGAANFTWRGKLFTTQLRGAQHPVAPRVEAAGQTVSKPPVEQTQKHIQPSRSGEAALIPNVTITANRVAPNVARKAPKPNVKPTETKVEVPTRTVKQRIPETKKPYITFKPGESQTFESKKSNVEPTKRYISNIEEARKVLKGRNVYNLPPANTLEGQQARNKQANPKHKGYLSGALRDARQF